MPNLPPSFFFDLSHFKHASLFDNCQHVWEALKKIEAYLNQTQLGKIQTTLPKNVFLEEESFISIGKGTVVEQGAYIRGPCLIGENCVIRHGAYIRGNFIAGDRCVIGHTTEVKNSIFLNDAHAAHFAYLGDSILGNRVNLGAGTKCANLKLDNRPVTIRINGDAIETGMRKFGAIIGDGSQLGCNSVTNPGTVLGQNVFCHPCTNVSGFVDSNQIVKSTEKNIIIKKK